MRKARLLHLLGCAAVLWLLPLTAQAVKPLPGVYSIDFDDTELIHRLAKGDPDIGVAGIDCGKVKGITKGRASIDCEIQIDEGGIEGDLEGTIEAEVFRTAGGETKIKFKADFDGEVEAGGDEFDAELVMKGSGKVVPGLGSVNFDVKIEVCLDDECQKEFERVSVVLETGDGSWSLDLTLVDKQGEKIRGTAIVAFADGKTLSFEAKGAHDALSGLSKITLTPTNGKPGLKLKLKNVAVSGDDLDGRLKYKLFGHQNGVDAALSGSPAP